MRVMLANRKIHAPLHKNDGRPSNVCSIKLKEFYFSVKEFYVIHLTTALSLNVLRLWQGSLYKTMLVQLQLLVKAQESTSNNFQNSNSTTYTVCILYLKVVTYLPYSTDNKKLTRRWDSERELFYDDIFNHFYAVRLGSYWIRWNNAK